MPAAKMIGRLRTAAKGSPWAAAPALIASSATSDAVSKPSPNRKPTGYICQLCRMTLKRRPKTLVMRPPATSS